VICCAYSGLLQLAKLLTLMSAVVDGKALRFVGLGVRIFLLC